MTRREVCKIRGRCSLAVGPFAGELTKERTPWRVSSLNILRLLRRNLNNLIQFNNLQVCEQQYVQLDRMHAELCAHRFCPLLISSTMHSLLIRRLLVLVQILFLKLINFTEIISESAKLFNIVNPHSVFRGRLIQLMILQIDESLSSS